MKNKFRRILNKNQAGFTLLETIVGLAISTLILSGTLITMHQLFFSGNNVRENMTSTQYVQNTGSWLRADVLMSQSIITGDNPSTGENETMTLYWAGASWKDAQDNDRIDYYEVSYYVDSEELRRKENVTTTVHNSNGQLIDTIVDETVALISDNITGINVISDNITLVVSISSLVNDAAVEKTYEIFPRAVK